MLSRRRLQAAEMLLHLVVVLVGSVGRSSAGVPKRMVLQNTVATLPCPHATGDVTWSRYRNGHMATLVTIRNGRENRTDRRYGSLANSALVITNVSGLDSTMYLCNGKQTVYLEVTTDPNMVDQEAPVTPGNDGPNLKGPAADAETQKPSDLWKVPVGAVIGACLVLLSIFTLRFCLAKRAGRNASVDQTVPEVVYEEIGDGGVEPRREPEAQSLYDWSNITDTTKASTAPEPDQYSTVNKTRTEGRSRDACVYHLVQNPLQTANSQ